MIKLKFSLNGIFYNFFWGVFKPSKGDKFIFKIQIKKKKDRYSKVSIVNYLIKLISFRLSQKVFFVSLKEKDKNIVNFQRSKKNQYF